MEFEISTTISELFNCSDCKIDFILYCLLSLMPFAILGYFFAKHENQEPSFLIGFDRMKSLKNAWTLLLVITAPLVFIYNVFVWAGWSFVVIARFIATVLKTIYDFIIPPIIKALKWIWNSIVWLFINIFWIPISMLFKALYHYCILWTWDLYKTAFQSLKGSYRKDKLTVGFSGAFYALSIIGLSVYLSVLFDFVAIGMIGLVIGALPALKAFGTITSMLHSDDGDHDAHGRKVMKTALNYVIGALVAIVAIEILLFLSFIPDFGLIVLGLAVNANVFLSAIILLAFFVLVFCDSLVPNHLLHHDEDTVIQGSVLNYLHAIKEKGVQLALSVLPGSMWGALPLILPIAFIYFSISTADSLKESVLDNRSSSINEDIGEAKQHLESVYLENVGNLEGLPLIEDAIKDAISLEMKSNQNAFGLNFPNNVIENPEIIFSNNEEEWTSSLPATHAGLVNDTSRIRGVISEAKVKISELTATLEEYKSQQWEYIVQRRNAKDAKDNWKTISSGADISRYVDKNISEENTYVYRIKAKNVNGSSAWSSNIQRTIGKTSLANPSSLVVRSEKNFSHILTWRDNSYNEDGFMIERKLSKDKKWKLLSTVGPDETIYVDSQIETGKSYDYRVLAEGLGGESKPTNIVAKKCYLGTPYSVNARANLKSILVDWDYNLTFSKNRNPGLSVENTTVGVFVNKELSLVDILESNIDEQVQIIEAAKEELVYTIAAISVFSSLISYDKSQRVMLKVFKNLAFLFALLFIALFGGMIWSIVMSYFSTLFYKTYQIRDKEPWYFIMLVNTANKANKNQPLLGFTLLVLVLLYISGDLNCICNWLFQCVA